MLAAAQAGLGVALARLPFAKTAVRMAGLVPLSRREAASPLTYHVVTRPKEVRTGVISLAARLARAAAACGPPSSSAVCYEAPTALGPAAPGGGQGSN